MSPIAPLCNIYLIEDSSWRIQGEWNEGAIFIEPSLGGCINFDLPVLPIDSVTSKLNIGVLSITTGLMGSLLISEHEEGITLLYRITIKKVCIDYLNSIWLDYKTVCSRIKSLLKNKNSEVFSLHELNKMVDETE